MEYSFLEHYLKTGKYHPSTPDGKKRGIRKASHNYVLKDDTLIYVGKGRMQIVCRSDYDKKKAVQWCHNNRLTNEPCNVKDTIKMLQKSYYWHGLNKDIEKRLFPCEICSSGTTHDSQLGRIQPLVNTVFESYKNNRDDSEASEIVVVKTESSPPPSLPPAPIVNESAIHDRFKDDDLSDDVDTPINGLHLALRNSANPFAVLAESQHQRTVELLLERISQLERFNSALVSENEELKDKVKALHTILENQKHLPLMKSLIDQLTNVASRIASSNPT